MLWKAWMFVCALSLKTVVSQINQTAAGANTENAVIEASNNCQCVLYYLCDSNNQIITTGEGLINIRLLSETNVTRIVCNGGKFEGEYVCCKLKRNVTSLTPEVKSPTDEEPVEAVKNTSCGVQRAAINVRIFAGEDELTPIQGEFPWIATIFVQEDDEEGYKFQCSGSLIHPKVILTANHYVIGLKPAQFRVVVNGNIELPAIGNNVEEERNIVEIIKHPEYKSGNLQNDAALLILDEPYVTTRENYINTICLPLPELDLKNVRCLVAGWGKGSEEAGKKIMKKVELPIVENNKCQDLLRKTRLGSSFNLHASFMCAGGEAGKDACNGDGGSSLVCPLPSSNKYFQIGIVSWGVGCGRENVPGVYGNVVEFRDWIKKELESRRLSK